MGMKLGLINVLPTCVQLPANVKLGSCSRLGNTMNSSGAVAELAAKAKGKGKAVENEGPAETAKGVESHDNRLATLDIFAGCGGLSEGLHQAGQSVNLDFFLLDLPLSTPIFISRTCFGSCSHCFVLVAIFSFMGPKLENTLKPNPNGKLPGFLYIGL